MGVGEFAVFSQIATECDRQDAKWGQQDHSPERWFAILGEEFGEVAREVTKWIPPRGRPPDAENYRIELIQLAAVAVRMIESFDRQAALAGGPQPRECQHEFGALGAASGDYCIHCGARLTDAQP